MTSDFISSYLTRAHHFMRLKSRVLTIMALTILRDLCLDEEVNTLFYNIMWQSQIEIKYSVAYFEHITKFDML